MNPVENLKKLIEEGKQIINPNLTKTNFLNWSDNVKNILEDSYGETSKAFRNFSSSSSVALDPWIVSNGEISEITLKTMSECIDVLGEIVTDIALGD